MPEISEAVWQGQIEYLCDLYKWLRYHTHNSQRSQEGFPDITLVHEEWNRLIFVELKKQSGKTSPAQDQWIRALGAVPGIEAYVWRPSDLDEARRVLSGPVDLPALVRHDRLTPESVLEGLQRLALVEQPVLDGSSRVAVTEVVRVADLVRGIGEMV